MVTKEKDQRTKDDDHRLPISIPIPIPFLLAYRLPIPILPDINRVESIHLAYRLPIPTDQSTKSYHKIPTDHKVPWAGTIHQAMLTKAGGTVVDVVSIIQAPGRSVRCVRGDARRIFTQARRIPEILHVEFRFMYLGQEDLAKVWLNSIFQRYNTTPVIESKVSTGLKLKFLTIVANHVGLFQLFSGKEGGLPTRMKMEPMLYGGMTVL